MCLNIYVPFYEIHDFKEFCKENDLIMTKKTQIDCFVKSGTVFRLHYKEDFENWKHNPDKVLNILKEKKKELPKEIQFQINKISSNNFLYKMAKSRFAVTQVNKKLSIELCYNWDQDSMGCYLGLICVPGFKYLVRDVEPRYGEPWTYYNVFFDQPVDKKKIFDYWFLGWRCSDTGVHSYFIINDPKRKVFLISTFRAEHYVPFDRSNYKPYDENRELGVKKEFRELVKNTENSLEGCLKIIKFLTKEEDKKYVDEVLKLI